MNENIALSQNSIPLFVAAESVGIPYQHLLMRVHRGKLKAFKIGRFWYITPDTLLVLEGQEIKHRRVKKVAQNQTVDN